ncbi:MAG TPA: LptA/OstA family protein [Candidatus Melainabacteria bacterium]|nr:LptA/OstA family protein [Candidatus Melainabacteria bacterium]
MIKRESKSYIYNLSILASILSLIAGTGPGIAQAPASGQIDIRAEEQEFAQDHVVATGKVRVDYGDTVIEGPKATLYRDENGAASQAIFTGHPRLVQGKNKINANKLTFNVKTSTIIAEGNAHSEVFTDDSGPPPPEDDLAKEKNKDKDKDKEKEANVLKPAAPAKKNEKIITDSHKQEYERDTGKFEAHGNVRVKTGDINVRSNHMKIVYGTDRKAEAAIFTGHAEARQGQNVTQADQITYFLTTQRLQATGNVRSKVIEEKTDASDSPELPDTEVKKTASAPENSNGNKIKFVSFGDTDNVDAPVFIFSDSQDYNKDTNRMDAVGNVKVYYQDTKGRGPRIALIKNKYGKAERVVFTGRSQITQPGRKWIGDRITLTLADRKVLAEGNTKAIIVQDDPTKQNNQKPRVAPQAPPAPDFARLAGTNNQLR